MMNIERGVPQGSVLRPLLFAMYKYDIANSIAAPTICMYADDTSLVVYCCV